MSSVHTAAHGAPETGTRLTTLDLGAGYVAVINTYVVAPERAEELLVLPRWPRPQ
jgi:hypothetical protein